VFISSYQILTFGPKRDEVTGECRKQHKELNDLYSLPTIVRVMKSRIMRLPGHVARMGWEKVFTRFWGGILRERDHCGDTGVGGRIILRRIFRKWNVKLWTRLSWLRIQTGGGHL
jgi:hypothetical protein